MTNRTKFILFVVGLLAVFVLIEYRMPRKFSWVPTFSHTDDQPFGCLLFDSLLTVSMPKGYTVTNRTLWQMKKDSVFTTPKGVMVITTEDVDALMGDVLDLASKGNIMLVATTDLYRWCDSLGIDFRYHSKFKIANITGKLPEMDTLCLADSFTPDSGLTVCEQLIECTLTIPDSVDCQVLARLYDTTEQPDDADTLVSSVVAATFPMGKGELILVSVPLLLTNYGTPDGPHEAPARDTHRALYAGHGTAGAVAALRVAPRAAAAMGCLPGHAHHADFLLLHGPTPTARHTGDGPTGQRQSGVCATHRHALLATARQCRTGGEEAGVHRRHPAP